ncbi:hypothetical protein GRAN_4477 [Granulicella sibirica]|uniref:Uncharacterized protein n=1 Tax=Granulicella sibirica TaxID=2479048 RepID=A0A4Q0SWC0_9BACT|nr:hypothetical protein GRAN_4477 [Granulicella sibirica]
MPSQIAYSASGPRRVALKLFGKTRWHKFPFFGAAGEADL